MADITLTMRVARARRRLEVQPRHADRITLVLAICCFAGVVVGQLMGWA